MYSKIDQLEENADQCEDVDYKNRFWSKPTPTLTSIGSHSPFVYMNARFIYCRGHLPNKGCYFDVVILNTPIGTTVFALFH